MILLRLFWEFFKTGLFAVGGGMATLPFLRDIGIRTGWFTQQKLADMIAVSESTPGPIGVNMATYVGFETAGIPGAVVATLGLICPSIIIILLIARVLKQFRSNQTVDAVFYGLRPCSIALIAAAGLMVAKLTFLNSDAAGAGISGSAPGADAPHQTAQKASPGGLYRRFGRGGDSVRILNRMVRIVVL